jgi:hypothetical protein
MEDANQALLLEAFDALFDKRDIVQATGPSARKLLEFYQVGERWLNL